MRTIIFSCDECGQEALGIRADENTGDTHVIPASWMHMKVQKWKSRELEFKRGFHITRCESAVKADLCSPVCAEKWLAKKAEEYGR